MENKVNVLFYFNNRRKHINTINGIIILEQMKKIVVLCIICCVLLPSLFGSVGAASLFQEGPKLSSGGRLIRPFFQQRLLESLLLLRQRGSKPFFSPEVFDWFQFAPEDIGLSDDAFHQANTFHFMEWWYFDAAFDNGYSAQMSIRVLSAANQGVVFLRLDIYKHGILVSHHQKPLLMRSFYASEIEPLIMVDGEQVMKGHIDEETGNWVYDISFDLSHASAELQFIGTTQGWKGQLYGGDWWGVILPQADVVGTLTLQGKQMDVQGVGYHDHNWEVTAFAGINFGWFWGKITSDSYSITWSNILLTRFTIIPIIVVNEKYGKYRSINGSNIQFLAEDFRFDKGLLIPYFFSLGAQDGDISLEVTMEVLNVHHERFMGVSNYWRYHVKCTGFICVGDQREQIDEILISEFIRFR